MLNVMVIPAYDVEKEDVEWQAFNYIDSQDDILNVYKIVKHLVPGVNMVEQWIKKSHWVTFRLPEYLDASKIKSTQYLVLNRCMEFDREKRNLSVL